MKPWNEAIKGLALLSFLLLGLGGCTSEAEAWYIRGVEAQSLDTMIFRYTKAIKLDPNYAFAYNNRGGAYNKKGLLDKAIIDASKAITLLKLEGNKHNLAVAYSNRGIYNRRNGSYARAIEDGNKAIELGPDYAPAYNSLAWLFATSPDAVFRNGKRAVELAERALELDRNAHNLDALSAAYAEAGKFQEAIRTQLQAIELAKKEGDESSTTNYEKHLERYNSRKPWREIR